MLKNINFLLLSLFSLFSISQNIDTNKIYWKNINCIKGNFNKFQVDNLGNVYSINGNTLIKYSPIGDTLFIQSVNYLGDITQLDIGQSFKPLLFFKEQQSLIYLDNTLSTNSEIALEKNDIYLAELVALSYTQNTLWLFDQTNTTLYKLDVNFNRIITISNLAQQLNMEINPTYLSEYNDYLYLYNPREGVLVFDLFGTFVKLIPIKNADFISIDNNYIYYIKENKLFGYNQKDLIINEIKIPIDNIKGFNVSDDKFYIQNNKGIFIYKSILSD